MLVLENRATYIRRELQAKVLKLLFAGTLESDIDDLPRVLFPRKREAIRCCIYKDRAITAYRLMAILGIGIEDEPDDPLPLREYARRALDRSAASEPVLTVIDEGCSACVQNNYFVTDACRGCVARPCSVNCPRDAISFEGDRAKIDPAACVNCGRCQGVCPYNAIVYQPVPCEEGCPVGAIKKDDRGREFIDYSLCIFCGRCTRACPFGAIMERSQIIDVGKHLLAERQVVAMVAPSIVGQFPGTLGQTVEGIRQIGFDVVLEVASGAEVTARNEAAEFVERLEQGDAMMGTSCCPAYTEAVRKHAPDFQKYVSDARTPMSYTAETAAQLYPDAVKVFIGPCIAKKFEGIHDDNVDYVLTYEELGAFLMARGIDTASVEESAFDVTTATVHGRGFPVSCGVTGALTHYVDGRVPVEPVLIDGLKKKGLNQLRAYGKGKAPGNLIEVMSCEGGCICGPGVVSNPKSTQRALKALLDQTPEQPSADAPAS